MTICRLYQMKDTAENHALLYQPYEDICRTGVMLTVSRYDMVYEGTVLSGRSMTGIRQEIEAHPAHTLVQRALSMGDVLELVNDDTDECFYIDALGMVPLYGFLSENSDSQAIPDPFIDAAAMLTASSRHFQIYGKPDGWNCIDTANNGRDTFFLMESEQYGRETACLILDAYGRVVLEDVTDGFSPDTLKKLNSCHAEEKNIVHAEKINDEHAEVKEHVEAQKHSAEQSDQPIGKTDQTANPVNRQAETSAHETVTSTHSSVTPASHSSPVPKESNASSTQEKRRSVRERLNANLRKLHVMNDTKAGDDFV